MANLLQLPGQAVRCCLLSNPARLQGAQGERKGGTQTESTREHPGELASGTSDRKGSPVLGAFNLAGWLAGWRARSGAVSGANKHDDR